MFILIFKGDKDTILKPYFPEILPETINYSLFKIICNKSPLFSYFRYQNQKIEQFNTLIVFLT
ncbi:MAG: hypothetical protein K0Q95_750 [Bacteroidota bacterium]|jgi:hypothetical protein|nr:hypothetical protein [Bacteroidota bacterium]